MRKKPGGPAAGSVSYTHLDVYKRQGYCTAAVTGSVSLGWAQLVADGSGGVKAAGEDAAGVNVLVVSTDAAEAGMIL